MRQGDLGSYGCGVEGDIGGLVHGQYFYMLGVGEILKIFYSSTVPCLRRPKGSTGFGH